MFHIGHLNILRKAKDLCDVLVVGVTTDELCYKRKRKYPIINCADRCSIVSAIRYVDDVVTQENMDKISMVKKLNCDVVFVGDDWKNTPSWIEYEKEFNKIGVDVIYLPHTDGISSTKLREKIKK